MSEKSEKAIPKYLQLKQEMITWLQDGKYKADEQLPSENEIAVQFGMSRQTVRQTFSELEQDGWLYRQQGKGTFVSGRKSKPAQETQTIGMITTYISDYIFPHIVRGTESELRSKGYRLTLSSTDNDKARERESLDLMMGQPLNGLIIEPTKSAQGNPNLSYFLTLEAQGIPYVMINEKYSELNGPCLRVDDEAGGYMAASHVIGLGHRRIAGFFQTDDKQGANRLKGFMRALRESNLPIVTEQVVTYSTEEKDDKPFKAALAMLQQSLRPTAFVCYNDELAIRLLEAARIANVSVPGELSIVGFDDSSLATATEVKLTSLTHPKEEMGRQAANLLLDMINGKASTMADDIVFSPELIVRESTHKIEIE